MSAENAPTPTTPTPSSVPAAPSQAAAPERPKAKSFDEAFSNIDKGRSPAAAPEATPPAAPSATTSEAKKRLLKLKIDHEESELDLDAEYDDETKRAALVERLQKGSTFDRAVKRAQDEAIQQARTLYTDWLDAHGYTVVADPTAPKGYKLVPKQAPVTTPAVAEDPLTTEETKLKQKIRADSMKDGADPTDIVRLHEIASERALKVAAQAKTEAVKEWEKRVADERAQGEQKRTAAEAETWFRGEIDKLIGARTKSFDGPDSAARIARLKQIAFAHGAAVAARGEKPVEAVAQFINQEADDLDARAKWVLQNATAQPQTRTTAPVVGSTPSGGGAPKKKFQNIDEALAAITANGRSGS
jgi:hypothetical protein